MTSIFLEDSVDKQIKIAYDGGVLNNDSFLEESMELQEAICKEEKLTYGCCYASQLSMTILDSSLSLKGKQLDMSITVAGEEPYEIGMFKVDSDKPTADRKYREIIAYDSMYDILNAEVSGWYNALLPDKDSRVTLKQFRDSFFAYLGIEQEEIVLVNDDMMVEKTVDPSQLSGETVITAICEINGCFGHIGREGKFHYIHLKQMYEGLFPSEELFPSDTLFPSEPKNVEKVSRQRYTKCTYEDYVTEKIKRVVIRKEENDIGGAAGGGDNTYIIQDNFLVYGKSGQDLNTIAANILSVIGDIWYRPAHVEAAGNPCLEVGDGIWLNTNSRIVCTYILQRTLKGIQALKDTYDSEGVEKYAERQNGLREQIIQLRGKTNTLFRSVEETRLEIADVENGLRSQITQTASEIRTDINAAAAGLSSRIEQNASGIEAEVNRATMEEGRLSAAIKLNADSISLKVNKDNIINEINLSTESAVIKAPKIDLKGLVTADEFVTKYATIETLDANVVNLNNVIITKASVDQLNATNANVSRLSADVANLNTIVAEKIDASTVKAQYMEVANWTSSGYIKASKLNASEIAAIFTKSNNIAVGGLDAISLEADTFALKAAGSILGHNVAWKSATVGGNTIHYLGY